jgi:two-component system, chemotaxis family, chemotaxis protein CheY
MDQTRVDHLKPTVMVVEDDWDVRDAVAEVLTDAGYAVVSASDGREALQLLRSNPLPSALLLDLFLPEMNGWQVYAQVQSNQELSQIPVIVMTAAGEHWGYPGPPAMVVRKPVDSERLLQLLGAATRAAPDTRH